jgi:uncharacterized protein (TIGR02001 family)
MSKYGRALLLLVAALAGALSIADGAIAIEGDIIESEVRPVVPDDAPAEFDFSFGIAATSDYVSRGITQTDSMPALQAYIEPTYGIAYLNVWASNVDFGEEFEGWEIDVGGGIRPEFGPLSLDLGYVHYFFAPEEISPDYGELFARADLNVQDMFTLGARVYYAPDFSQTGKDATWVAGGARVPLPKNFSIYGGVGYQFFEDPDAHEQLAWTAGVSYSFEILTFDVRYWDTDLSDDECAVRSGFEDGCDERLVGTVSVGVTWSDLVSAAVPAK